MSPNFTELAGGAFPQNKSGPQTGLLIFVHFDYVKVRKSPVGIVTCKNSINLESDFQKGGSILPNLVVRLGVSFYKYPLYYISKDY